MAVSLIIGVDPGLSGAICFRRSLGMAIMDMPTVEIRRGKSNKRELDLAALVANLKDECGQHPVDVHAFVEQAGAMPGQGVTSMFAFGKSYGSILGILAAFRIPVTLVHPTVWKKALQVPKGKDAARHRASQLLPRYVEMWPLKKHDGRAEAALVAEYGARTLGITARAA